MQAGCYDLDINSSAEREENGTATCSNTGEEIEIYCNSGGYWEMISGQYCNE